MSAEDITSTITELHRGTMIPYAVETGKVAVTESGDWILTGITKILYADATADTESTAAQTACTVAAGKVTFVQATAATVRYLILGLA